MARTEAELTGADADRAAATPGEQAAPIAERAGALAALSTRPFALFWSTILFSLVGVWVRITAQGWLVFELTHNSFQLGLVSFCGAAPQLISAPIAGALLDRLDRRRVLMLVQLVAASCGLTLAILVATGLIQVWQIMLMAIILGTASGFDWPARLSLAPLLVPPARLQSAVALTAAAFNFSRVIGPVVGGVLIGTLGITACYYLNAAAYLPFIVALAVLTVDHAGPVGATAQGAFREFAEGLRYIRHEPAIRGLLSIDVIPVMFGVTYLTLAPAIATDVLGFGGGGLGALLAFDGAGSLLGTALVAVLSRTRRRGRLVITGVGLFGVTLIAFASSSYLYLSLILIFTLGFVIALYGTFNDTLIQTLVAEQYRGRVLAVYSMLWGPTPVGALEAGFVADRVGVQIALAINGLIVLSWVPVLLRFTPVRHVD